jgi:predicted TPR repeat methyltransferase
MPIVATKCMWLMCVHTYVHASLCRCLKSMFRLGRASELMGNTPAALAAYKRALLVAPGDQEVASKLQQLSGV